MLSYIINQFIISMNKDSQGLVTQNIIESFS